MRRFTAPPSRCSRLWAHVGIQPRMLGPDAPEATDLPLSACDQARQGAAHNAAVLTHHVRAHSFCIFSCLDSSGTSAVHMNIVRAVLLFSMDRHSWHAVLAQLFTTLSQMHQGSQTYTSHAKVLIQVSVRFARQRSIMHETSTTLESRLFYLPEGKPNTATSVCAGRQEL